MNLEHLIAEEGTHSDHGEKDYDGAKDGLCWGDAHDFLREIETIDSYVQCGENLILALGLFGFVGHGRKAK